MPLGSPTTSKRTNGLSAEELGQLFDDFAAELTAFFAYRTYDADLSLDLMAETFAQALRGRKGFRGTTRAEAEAWLYAIARRLFSRYQRRGKLERKALRSLGMQLPEASSADIERVEELIDMRERREELRQALEQLSEAQREAIRLRVIDELSYAEVASRTGVSEQTVRARVSRGLSGLANSLDAPRGIGGRA